MLKLILAAVVVGALFFSNPPLSEFKGAVNKQIDEQRSSMRAGLGFNLR